MSQILLAGYLGTDLSSVVAIPADDVAPLIARRHSNRKITQSHGYQRGACGRRVNGRFARAGGEILAHAAAAFVEVLHLAPIGAFGLPPSEVYRKAEPSVVVVQAEQSRDDPSQGSGVVVAQERVITNCHVMRARNLLI
jgi:hypothetical protein